MCSSRQCASNDTHHDPFVTPGSPRDLELRSNFNLTFQGKKKVHHSTRFDERNTMKQRSCLYLF